MDEARQLYLETADRTVHKDNKVPGKSIIGSYLCSLECAENSL